MILVDANLLLYAYNPSVPQHARARVWFEATLSRSDPVRMAWVTILAFVRIGTSPRVFGSPFATDEAVAVVSTWLARPTVAVLEPGERHWAILGELLARTQARGPLVADAHLAALAIEHGATLCTSDGDFARFPGLRMLNPMRAGD